MKNHYLFVGFFVLALILPQRLHAQVIATAVGEVSITLDDETAQKGFTLRTDDTRVRVGILPGTLQGGSRVTLTTYSSDRFDSVDGYVRVTPLYRVQTRSLTGTDLSVSFPFAISYPSEDVGVKVLRSWEEDSSWTTKIAKNDQLHNELRGIISERDAFFSVFSDPQKMERGVASWYTQKGCLCAASPDYTKGTKLKVTNTTTGSSVVVRVNDYGPDRSRHPDRVIDLDKVAFQKIASLHHGLVSVAVEKVQ